MKKRRRKAYKRRTRKNCGCKQRNPWLKVRRGDKIVITRTVGKNKKKRT